MDLSVCAAVRRARPRIRLKREVELKLWRRMRKGDLDARSQLIESQLPWLIRLASKFQSPRHTVDDLFQIAAIELINCLRTFDARISRLSSYCTRVVRWRLIQEIQKDCPALMRPANRPVPRYREQWARAGGETATVDPSYVQKESPPDVFAPATSESPCGAVRNVIELRLAGETLKQVGERFGSRERIRQIEDQGHGLLAQWLQ